MTGPVRQLSPPDQPKKDDDWSLSNLEYDLVGYNIISENYNNLLLIGVDRPGEASMAERQKHSLSQRYREFQASKAVLFWACAGSVALAIVVGFAWGGWVTGGSAKTMAAEAAAQARQEMAAVVCVDRFMAAEDAGVKLAALHEITSAYAQGKFVEEGGWATILPAGSATDRAASADNRKAAALCAVELAKREIPPLASAATPISDEATLAQ
jgi:hypothetical protein